MSPDDKAPMEPIVMTMVGSVTGDGGVPLQNGQVVKTPDHQPNVVVNVITPLVALAVRFGNEWCVSFGGSLLAGGLTSRVLPHTDMQTMLGAAVILATSVAGVGLVKNAGTIFSGLEKKFPLGTGSV